MWPIVWNAKRYCHFFWGGVKTISGFNCSPSGGNLLDLFVNMYEMKAQRRGEALMRMLCCFAGARNHFDVSLSATKWIQIPGCWDQHMHCRRARSWANERAHTFKNRPVNSKAGIYVCSELWKPQGQNIYMKSKVSVCVVACRNIYFHLCVYMNCRVVLAPVRVWVCAQV